MDSVCNKNPKLLVYVEPTDLNIEDAQSKLKVRLWNQTVDRYGMQMATLNYNMGTLFALLHDNISKLVKSKVRAKKGYTKAEEDKDALWLLNIVQDITLNLEETKPKLLAVGDQMEHIMKLKQGKLQMRVLSKCSQKN